MSFPFPALGSFKVARGLLALFLLALAGRVSAQPADLQAPLKPAALGLNYQISPSDILSITVFQEEDLKSLVRVSNDGNIAFPLIGIVPVQGLSPQAAARAIETRLAPGYLLNPQVNVTVMEFSKRRFTVLGQVQKPGSYDMPDQQDMSVLQAIGTAGGYTRIADARKVTLMRKTDGKAEVYHFNAQRMAAGNDQSAFTVLPGDVITVAESRF